MQCEGCRCCGSSTNALLAAVVMLVCHCFGSPWNLSLLLSHSRVNSKPSCSKCFALVADRNSAQAAFSQIHHADNPEDCFSPQYSKPPAPAKATDAVHIRDKLDNTQPCRLLSQTKATGSVS